MNHDITALEERVARLDRELARIQRQLQEVERKVRKAKYEALARSTRSAEEAGSW